MEIKKALVLFPLADGQTGPAIVRALENNGILVTALDPNVAKTSDILMAADRFDGELAICGREMPLVPIIEEIRYLSGAFRLVVWNPDVRDTIMAWEPLWPLFREASVYYTVGLSHIARTESASDGQKWREHGINAWWLPQGLQDELYHPERSEGLSEDGKYVCDVAFAGGEYGMHAGRSELLDALEASDIDLKLYGCRGRPAVWGREHNLMSSRSKINIAHSGWPQVQCYMSVRALKLMGAGGFVLANGHAGIADWVPIYGEHAVMGVYTSTEDCLQKIDYWLGHEEERIQVARNGYEWAKKNTYTQRIRIMLTHLQGGKYFGDEQVFDPRLISPFALEGCEEVLKMAQDANEPFRRKKNQYAELTDKFRRTRNAKGEGKGSDEAQEVSGAFADRGGAPPRDRDGLQAGRGSVGEQDVAPGAKGAAEADSRQAPAGDSVGHARRSIHDDEVEKGDRESAIVSTFKTSRAAGAGNDQRAVEAGNGGDRLGQRYVATVAEPAVEGGLRDLVESLRYTGWEGQIRIFSPRPCEEGWPHIEGETAESLVVTGRSAWWEQFAPAAGFMYYNACYLKPCIIDDFEDGDEVVYLDGADTFALNPIDGLFDLLEMADLVFVPGEPEKEDPLIGGFCELFDRNSSERVRANNGVFAFRASRETRRFFDLWRAFCGWSVAWGLGDMSSFNLALTVYGGKTLAASRGWNWLAAESETYSIADGKLLTDKAQEVFILHGAGSGKEDFRKMIPWLREKLRKEG